MIEIERVTDIQPCVAVGPLNDQEEVDFLDAIAEDELAGRITHEEALAAIDREYELIGA